MSTSVRETAAAAWSARAVTVVAGNAPSLVAAADLSRRNITVVNIGTVPVFLTHIAAVSGSNAFQLAVGAGYDFENGEPIYAFLAPGEVTDGLLNTLAQTGEK